jgi:hypothetical protein
MDVKKRCSICNSAENEQRFIGNYLVKLTYFVVDGEEKLICQGCKRKIKTNETLSKESHSTTLKNFFRFWNR